MDYDLIYGLLGENEINYRDNIDKYITSCQSEHCECPRMILSRLSDLSREYSNIVKELYGTQSVIRLKKFFQRSQLNDTQEETP